MQIKKNIFALLGAILCLLPYSVEAQSSSISVFSPYTIYGIGEISSGAPTFLRSMGGAGVAYSSPVNVNYLNPASNSAVLPNAFIMSVGAEGGGYYLNSGDSKTSGNTFNFSDLAVRFPVAKNMGLSVSVTPYSSVGYSIRELDELSYDESVDYNAVMNTFAGEGSVSQFKVGFGAKIFKNFSLGADMIYYTGTIARTFNTVILTNNTSNKEYDYVSAYTQTLVSSFSGTFGMQYLIPFDIDNNLTLGVTYRLGGKLSNETVRVVPTNNDYDDYVEYDEYEDDIYLPSILSVGASFRGRRYLALLDYTFSKWDGTNEVAEQKYSSIKYTNTHTVKLGAEYTPNRFSMRNYMSKLTYRVGASFGNNYITYYDTPMNNASLTFGVGFPLGQTRLSSVNLNVELGQTGLVKNEIFKQQYFKVSVGFNFVGEDQWFVKPKLN